MSMLIRPKITDVQITDDHYIFIDSGSVSSVAKNKVKTITGAYKRFSKSLNNR